MKGVGLQAALDINVVTPKREPGCIVGAEKGRSSLHFIANASAPTNNYRVISALNYSYSSLPYMEIPFCSLLFSLRPLSSQ